MKPKLFECFISHIRSDGKNIEVWAQTDAISASRVESSLESIHKQLSDLFAIRHQHAVQPQVGNYFVTQYVFHCLTFYLYFLIEFIFFFNSMKNDLHFYRVVVTHFEPNSDKALVSFIDFGNEEYIPINNLIVCESVFSEKPLAYKYLLADIKPKDKSKEIF
jgi:tRNA-binding EMAP/Myf-like protein